MIAQLATFELRRAAERRIVPIALLLFTAALAIGHVDHWRGKAPNGTAFFGYAYLIGLVLLMRFGLAADRQLRFDEYLLVNHVRPRTYLAAKACAMGALLFAYCLLGALVEIVFAGGGVSEAAWIAVAWSLTAWLFAPIAMLVETWLDTSVPVAVVLLVYVIVVMTEYMSRHTIVSVEMLGVRQLAPGDWASLGPLALRALLGAPIGFLAVGALARFRLRRY